MLNCSSKGDLEATFREEMELWGSSGALPQERRRTLMRVLSPGRSVSNQGV